jgi:hypothetical protein
MAQSDFQMRTNNLVFFLSNCACSQLLFAVYLSPFFHSLLMVILLELQSLQHPPTPRGVSGVSVPLSITQVPNSTPSPFRKRGEAVGHLP